MFDWPAVGGGGTTGCGAETGEGGPPCHCGDERVVRAGGPDGGGRGWGWPTENTRYNENTVWYSNQGQTNYYRMADREAKRGAMNKIQSTLLVFHLSLKETCNIIENDVWERVGFGRLITFYFVPNDVGRTVLCFNTGSRDKRYKVPPF